MLNNVSLSLCDLLGDEYLSAVCAARAFLTGESADTLRAIAEDKIDCWPEAFARRQEELMDRVGQSALPPCKINEPGAASGAYAAAQHAFAAPLSALGGFRLGEDGRVYFSGKSEHYQIPWDTAFPATGSSKTSSAWASPMPPTTTPGAS